MSKSVERLIIERALKLIDNGHPRCVTALTAEGFARMIFIRGGGAVLPGGGDFAGVMGNTWLLHTLIEESCGAWRRAAQRGHRVT